MRRGDDDFCFGIERSIVEMVHYVCNRLDRAVPKQPESIGRSDIGT